MAEIEIFTSDTAINNENRIEKQTIKIDAAYFEVWVNDKLVAEAKP